MKYALLLFAILLTCSALAQTQCPVDSLLGVKRINPEELRMPINELKKSVGKQVYIYDNIWGVKAINDSLKVLYVGGMYPHHTVSILIKGRKTIQQLNHLYDGVASHFSGEVVMYEGKPAIIITHEWQILKQIMI